MAAARRARVTLAHLSAELGLGVATVSRALSLEPHPDVSEATRERVRAAADRLGYRPSRTARALRSGDYHAISVVVPDNAWGWWEPVLRAATSRAGELGYQLFAHPVAGRSGGAAAVVQSLADVPTDAVLLLGSAADPDVAQAAARVRLPAVAIDDVSASVVVPTLRTDSAGGVQQLTRLLIEAGRRHLLYVGLGEPRDLYSIERQEGFHAALGAHASRHVTSRVISVAAPAHIEEFADIVRFDEVDRFFDSGAEVDAVICEFDALAPPLYRTLHERGLSVPDDVAVVGFDDERAARIVDPPLTTMRQPYEQMGRAAVDLLMDAIAGDAVTVAARHFPPALVVRQSTP